jgi:hypothetical protein
MKMKFCKGFAAVVAMGVVSVLAVQWFYRTIYRKWQYFTLYDGENPPE